MIVAAHEAAVHAAQLRVELSQSRKEQRDYLKNVELARVLDKRSKRKAATRGDDGKEGDSADTRPQKVLKKDSGPTAPPKEKRKKPKLVGVAKPNAEAQLESVLGSIF